MLRLVFVIGISFPIVLYYVIKSNYVTFHMDKYSELTRYKMAQRMVRIMKHNGRIETDVYGVENLPKDSGYVLYPNHQGKYDALGIIAAHEKPCTFMIDAKRAKLPFAREFANILEASKLDKTNPKHQVETIHKVISQIEGGKHYIIFPEGGYAANKGNEITKFRPGAFKCSIRSKTPIVPVALIDSYKVFGVNSLKKIKTEVHFLKPLYFEDYKDLSSFEIASIVQERIQLQLGGHA